MIRCCLLALAACFASTNAKASITTYDTRNEFELSVVTTILEDFNSTTGTATGLPGVDLGAFSVGNTTGINFLSPNDPFIIDGTVAGLNGTSTGVDTIFTFDSPINAFALDTAQLNDYSLRTTVEADGMSVPIGFVDDFDGLTFFGFSSTTAFSEVRFIGGTSDGWSFDNLTYATFDDGVVPEPASLAVWSGIAALACFGVWRKRRTA